MNIDDAVRAIESSDEFKLLRSLKGPSDWGLKGTNSTALAGLYVDVETTGLSTSKDEIVELQRIQGGSDRQGQGQTIINQTPQFSWFNWLA